MIFYEQADMVYADYNWTASMKESTKLINQPDRNLFNRHEGYEILYIINVLGEIVGRTSKTDGNKMERLLHEKLPLDIKSQWTVCKWLGEQLN